ncbi:hypothetical protein, partial [Sinorhizobium meliloti]|uniref:hypothetical protein n=6 Tax=Rhizobium meliloti TaxID=382 RepID=UPI001AEBC06B
MTAHIARDFRGKSGAAGRPPASRIFRDKAPQYGPPEGFCTNRPLPAAFPLQRGQPFAAEKSLALTDLCKIKP